MPFDRHAKLAFIIACVTLLASGIGFQSSLKYLKFFLKKEPVEPRQSFSNIPRVMQRWKAVGEDRQLDASMIEALGTKLYLDRLYAIDGDRSKGALSVQVAYYTGMIDTVPHVPDRCFQAAGFVLKELPENYPLAIDRAQWRKDPVHINSSTGEPYPILTYHDRITSELIEVRMPLDDFFLRVTEFQWPQEPSNRIYAGYLFIANGRTTATPTSIRKLAFDRTNKYAYYCKVQFNLLGGSNTEPEEFVRLSADLMNDLLPELMRCLPDWSDVEARERAESAAASKPSEHE
jgi:hypothetical protein